MWLGQKGDLTLYLTHLQWNPNEAEEPALYIRNEKRRHPDGGCNVFMMPLQDLWMFRPEDRDRGRHHDIGEMVACLTNASIALYGLDVPQYRFRIHDAILEFADDLKNLKPPPEMTREQWFDQLARHGVHVKINGQQMN